MRPSSSGPSSSGTSAFGDPAFAAFPFGDPAFAAFPFGDPAFAAFPFGVLAFGEWTFAAFAFFAMRLILAVPWQTGEVRLLLDSRDGTAFGVPVDDLDGSALSSLYAFGDGPRLRAGFVSTLDGSAVGPDGLSGSINTPADNRVFALQRRLCDAVLVGAGTARAEGYTRVAPTAERPDPPALVVVSGSATPPPALLGPGTDLGRGILVTCTAAGDEARRAAREVVGDDNLWVVGDEAVDLAALVHRLGEAGMPHVLAEGGPTLITGLLAVGLVDELALTLVPRVVGGTGTRITHGELVDVDLAPVVLLEEDGTVLGLWRVGLR